MPLAVNSFLSWLTWAWFKKYSTSALSSPLPPAAPSCCSFLPCAGVPPSFFFLEHSTEIVFRNPWQQQSFNLWWILRWISLVCEPIFSSQVDVATCHHENFSTSFLHQSPCPVSAVKSIASEISISLFVVSVFWQCIDETTRSRGGMQSPSLRCYFDEANQCGNEYCTLWDEGSLHCQWQFLEDVEIHRFATIPLSIVFFGVLPSTQSKPHLLTIDFDEQRLVVILKWLCKLSLQVSECVCDWVVQFQNGRKDFFRNSAKLDIEAWWLMSSTQLPDKFTSHPEIAGGTLLAGGTYSIGIPFINPGQGLLKPWLPNPPWCFWDAWKCKCWASTLGAAAVQWPACATTGVSWIFVKQIFSNCSCLFLFALFAHEQDHLLWINQCTFKSCKQLLLVVFCSWPVALCCSLFLTRKLTSDKNSHFLLPQGQLVGGQFWMHVWCDTLTFLSCHFPSCGCCLSGRKVNLGLLPLLMCKHNHHSTMRIKCWQNISLKTQKFSQMWNSHFKNALPENVCIRQRPACLWVPRPPLMLSKQCSDVRIFEMHAHNPPVPLIECPLSQDTSGCIGFIEQPLCVNVSQSIVHFFLHNDPVSPSLQLCMCGCDTEPFQEDLVHSSRNQMKVSCNMKIDNWMLFSVHCSACLFTMIQLRSLIDMMFHETKHCALVSVQKFKWVVHSLHLSATWFMSSQLSFPQSTSVHNAVHRKFSETVFVFKHTSFFLNCVFQETSFLQTQSNHSHCDDDWWFVTC